MKLETGKDVYPLSDFGEMYSLAVDTGLREGTGRLHALRQITPADWDARRGDKTKPPTRGIPVCFAIAGPTPDLCLYPAPDEDYLLVGLYYPAIRSL